MVARRISALVLLTLAVSVAGVLDAAVASADCGDRFPNETWELVGETALLSVSAVGVPTEQALRFADEANATARLLEADFGEVPPLELCVFGREVRLDPTGLVPPGQLLHAAVFADEGTVYVGAIGSRLFDETHSFGLAYAVLWDQAARLGMEGYPEPLATAIGQWYLSRVSGKVELHHNQMRGGAFFRDPAGGGIETTDWATAHQPPIYTWNPEFQEAPIGDLVDFAVGTYGTEVLSDPDPVRWADIEQEWQAALREEALQGTGGSGSAWVIGLAIVVGFVGLAALMAWLTRRSRIKAREQARARAQASP